jgi:hypothetical protein
MNLKATITEITNYGMVTVTFNEEMMIPANFTTFNSSVLELSIVPFEE